MRFFFLIRIIPEIVEKPKHLVMFQSTVKSRKHVYACHRLYSNLNIPKKKHFAIMRCELCAATQCKKTNSSELMQTGFHPSPKVYVFTSTV